MGKSARRAAAGDPQILIMTSLASGPKHGYALIQDIEAFARLRLGAGTLYGAIGRLEERGLIEALAGDGRRRPYRLSAQGQAALEAALADWDAIVRVGAARLAGRAAASPALSRGVA
jgi:DNA-binding PadR family transcriptional regulator